MAILIQYANGVPGVKFLLDKSEITIGRALDNDISIDDEFVSKRHAVIQLVEDETTSHIDCILIDNNSTNHTYVNNTPVSVHRLDNQDKIYIGQNEFRFSANSVVAGEMGSTQLGFFEDDAPGLMHAKLEKAEMPTSRLDEISDPFEGLSIDDSLLEDLSETRHQLDYSVNSSEQEDDIASSQLDEKSNKRFSRRLSLL